MSDAVRLQIVDQFLSRQPLPTGPSQPCPYLPGRTSKNQGFTAERLEPAIYHALMDRGFRRSGHVLYRPACEACCACTPVRVVVSSFKRSKSQERVWRRNDAIGVSIGLPRLTESKWRLFQDYLAHQHDDLMNDSYDDLREFLYESPVETVEFTYELAGQIVGISIADISADAVSSVYMFFDPRLAERSLGTYSVLWEIEYCRLHNIPHYYLGYYVHGCRKMEYKVKFRPCELLSADNVWSLTGCDAG